MSNFQVIIIAGCREIRKGGAYIFKDLSTPTLRFLANCLSSLPENLKKYFQGTDSEKIMRDAEVTIIFFQMGSVARAVLAHRCSSEPRAALQRLILFIAP